MKSDIKNWATLRKETMTLGLQIETANKKYEELDNAHTSMDSEMKTLRQKHGQQIKANQKNATMISRLTADQAKLKKEMKKRELIVTTAKYNLEEAKRTRKETDELRGKIYAGMPAHKYVAEENGKLLKETNDMRVEIRRLKEENQALEKAKDELELQVHELRDELRRARRMWEKTRSHMQDS